MGVELGTAGESQIIPDACFIDHQVREPSESIFIPKLAYVVITIW